jgi:hypothetical protein
MGVLDQNKPPEPDFAFGMQTGFWLVVGTIVGTMPKNGISRVFFGAHSELM